MTKISSWSPAMRLRSIDIFLLTLVFLVILFTGFRTTLHGAAAGPPRADAKLLFRSFRRSTSRGTAAGHHKADRSENRDGGLKRSPDLPGGYLFVDRIGK